MTDQEKIELVNAALYWERAACKTLNKGDSIRSVGAVKKLLRELLGRLPTKEELDEALGL